MTVSQTHQSYTFPQNVKDLRKKSDALKNLKNANQMCGDEKKFVCVKYLQFLRYEKKKCYNGHKI